MNNTAENLDHLTYQMTDEEIYELADIVYENNKHKYGIIDVDNMSYEIFNKISDALLTVPLSRNEIDTLSKTVGYTREQLEEENRKLYAERKWEQYI